MKNWIQRISLNTRGRDFIVGDIHGCYEDFEKCLAKVGFDPAVDRVFPVGDLVDRGPHNERVLDYLGKGWFLPVIGNHEAFILKLYRDGPPSPAMLKESLEFKKAGFEWWGKTSHAFRNEFIEKVGQLPIATELQTRLGKVGIIHADVPKGLHWDHITTLINHPEEAQRKLLLSERTRMKKRDETPVPGVERVYVGHNVVKSPVILGNLVALDTGAYMGKTKRWGGKGSLSLVRADVSWEQLREALKAAKPRKGLVIA
jgi:serine/threonine protein phosphatase 1